MREAAGEYLWCRTWAGSTVRVNRRQSNQGDNGEAYESSDFLPTVVIMQELAWSNAHGRCTMPHSHRAESTDRVII